MGDANLYGGKQNEEGKIMDYFEDGSVSMLRIIRFSKSYARTKKR